MKEYDKKYEEIITKCVEDSDNHKIVKNVKRIDFYNLKEGNGFIQFLIDNKKEFKQRYREFYAFRYKTNKF